MDLKHVCSFNLSFRTRRMINYRSLFVKEAENNIDFILVQLFILNKNTVKEGVYMPNQKNSNPNTAQHKNQVSRLNKEKDTFDIINQEMEVDTDVNEDPNREKLLDESVDAFLQSKEEQQY